MASSRFHSLFALAIFGGIALAMEPPLGLTPMDYPSSNTYSVARVALGRTLFFDPSLSADGTISCATCHLPEKAFADGGAAVSTGNGGRMGRRNTPSILNSGYVQSLFHDGRAASLEAQAWQPLLAHDEMGNTSEAAVLDRLSESTNLVAEFQAAFGVTRPDRASVAKALAAFQRSLVSANSPFDRWNWGHDDAMSPLAVKGQHLFAGRAQCWQCHTLGATPLLLTDHKFHNTGVAAARGEKPVDLGRFEVTDNRRDRGAFRTPSLRNVALTPPYMHDGSIATLEDVVRFYIKGVGPDVDAVELSDDEVAALVAFLQSLTSTPVPSRK